LIKNYSSWFGLKYKLLFFYNVYGNGQINNGKMATIIGIFETQYRNKKPLTIVKPGTQKRDFTHIDDIIEGCYFAMIKGKNTEYMFLFGKSIRSCKLQECLMLNVDLFLVGVVIGVTQPS
tara:strand:+ start:210 stop:569 length:360 start_codon:yes stop_codon:yes gene_type:complete